MKNIFAILLLTLCVTAQAQIEIPQASPAGSVTTRIGLTDIKIDYFRPRMKGRKIFGEGDTFLQPNGKIWRTGANSGTKITFSDDVKVEGVAVPKGSYLLFTWPGASEWTVALYNDLTIGGNTDQYDQKKEAARFKVKSEKLAETISTLTMAIGDLNDENTMGKIQMAWENTSVKFSVTVEFEAKVMASIEANTHVNPNNLMAAAHYYYDSKKDLKQALVWVNEYFADPKKNVEFWNLNFKAQLQKALGDKAGAIASAQKSIESAKASGNDFGYVKQNEDLIKSLK